MSHITIQRYHELKPAALRKRVESLAKELQGRFGGDYRWDGNTLHYTYSGGIDARLTLTREDVDISVKLGLMMRMMKARLEAHINKYLDEHLG